MARRYTITNVTEVGSGVKDFRDKISSRQTAWASPNKGFSDDARMRNMFPKSPLYAATSDYNTDAKITNIFKTEVIDINSQSNYDFSGTDVAYMNFTHPNSPDLDMTKLNKPISGSGPDNPYYGHPNLQVNSIDPLVARTVVTSSDDGLLRARTATDGGFGRKYKTNYATSLNDDMTIDEGSTIVNIGKYFSKIYNSEVDTQIADSKKNLLGSSRATQSNENSASINDTGEPLAN